MSGSVWIVSYVFLWAAVIVLGFSVIALLRQVGVLHLRVAPMGVHFAGEGPELDRPAPDIDLTDYTDAEVTVLAFITPTCEICQSLKPDLQRIEHDYDEVAVRVIDHDRQPESFANFKVRSTPYLIAIDRDGLVRSRGVANSIDQVEEMLAEVLAGPPVAPEMETSS
jgi:thiol-disulfide isomerase/thioredoxin